MSDQQRVIGFGFLSLRERVQMAWCVLVGRNCAVTVAEYGPQEVEGSQCPTWLPNDQTPPVPHVERQRCMVPMPHGPGEHRTAKEIEGGL